MNGIPAYLAELRARLRGLLGDDLVGLYAGGSYALGDYEPGRSDLDVAAVVRRPLARARKQQIVAAARHEALPCPARGLELVVYRLAAVREPSTAAAFELNLNTGARMAFRADFEPDADEAFWFPIDRSILGSRGLAVDGPPAGDVFAQLSRDDLLPILATALRQQLAGGSRGDDAVLNACRARRFAAEGMWSSKREAGAWALSRGAPRLVADAARAREDGSPLDPAAVRAFVEAVADEVATL